MAKVRNAAFRTNSRTSCHRFFARMNLGTWTNKSLACCSKCAWRRLPVYARVRAAIGRCHHDGLATIGATRGLARSSGDPPGRHRLPRIFLRKR